jgi:phosphatidylinositol glycan class P protein
MCVSIVLFLMWAYLPEETLEAYGLTYYPSKHWALAMPSMLVVTYLFSIVVYKACNLLSTPPLDAYATVLDSHSVFLYSNNDDNNDNSLHHNGDSALDAHADAATPPICDLSIFDVNSYMLDT